VAFIAGITACDDTDVACIDCCDTQAKRRVEDVALPAGIAARDDAWYGCVDVVFVRW